MKKTEKSAQNFRRLSDNRYWSRILEFRISNLEFMYNKKWYKLSYSENMTEVLIFVSVFHIKRLKARFRVRVQYSTSESSTKQTLN